MRKILFTLLAVGAMLVAIPAASLAHGGDHHQGDRHREREHQRDHRHARDHDRIRHEHFGRHDGFRTVGTVSAFANGRLTIHLNDGSSVTGAINRFSEIECEMPEFMHRADQGPGGSGSGSSGGPGNDNGQNDPGHNGGDDNGQNDPGHNGGDDNGEHQCTMIAPGMVVRDATLTLTGFGAVWTRVDLIDS
jgi:Ni/Co efflux regulator RcnB